MHARRLTLSFLKILENAPMLYKISTVIPFITYLE